MIDLVAARRMVRIDQPETTADVAVTEPTAASFARA